MCEIPPRRGHLNCDHQKSYLLNKTLRDNSTLHLCLFLQIRLLVSIFSIRYTSLKHTFCCLFFIKRSVLSYFHLDRHFHFQSQGNKSYTLGMKNTRMDNREWTTLILPSLPLARHHTVYVRLSEACLAPPKGWCKEKKKKSQKHFECDNYVPNIRL